MHLRWERHTEFHTCTFWTPLGQAPQAFESTAIAEMGRRLKAIQDELESSEARWLELGEQIEALG